MKAKRGDLVAVVSQVSDYVIGQGATTRESVTLGRVTSVTREGVVKVAKSLDLGGSALYNFERDRSQVVLVPRTVDPFALVEAYCARRYPTAPDSKMVPPFASLSECREFVRPFVGVTE